MHQIVMVLGAVVAFMGLLFGVLVIFVGRDTSGLTLLIAFGIGGGMVLSGAMLYCFGAIVDHLIAIRANTEQQLQIFNERLGTKA